MSGRNRWVGSVSAISVFAVGVGIGAALGVLFAPQSGDDLRDAIVTGAQEGMNEAIATGQKLTRHAKEGIEQVKGQVRQATEVGERAFREAKNSAS
jgi:gas vesicle protein